ncbi:tryptophan halogenase [Maricaulis sp. W15]|uniref:tryptophan halogenase family protein n=1 Tax=Maricaulis sp. W15 TaxID=1772333 RepID=UPI00094897B9|nr:tryptophan halogenase family protein [Maricaulis sp. W15]OLF81104.1 tryptophan halogenase [Maricaulis sp. W15]
MSDNKVDHILIIGGGTAGWMCAAALSHRLRADRVRIELVESEGIGTVGVGESTIPHIRHFNASLGIDEADFMARTHATYKLAIEFRDWGRIGDSYMHPFGAFGVPGAVVDFHHDWLRSGGETALGSIDDYSLPIAMARGQRFARPASDPRDLASTYAYAFQFDAAAYARYLRDFAEARGVIRTEGRVTDVQVDGETGHVRNVSLESGQRIEADLFIDCSGFRGLITEQALATGYEDWSHWLPCDRAIALPSAATGELPPYTRATALEAGWAWRIPLQHRVGNGHVYASAFMDDERAETLLRDQLEGEALAEPNRLRFLAGKRKRQWNRNCVAIGLSSGFLEPLESTSIHLIQSAIGHLLDLFPTGEWDPAEADEFNRVMDQEYARIRDFLILHYKATQRDDTEFWRHCREMDIPDSLAGKIEHFRERGLIADYEHGVFLKPSWQAVFLGQHITPQRLDPRAVNAAAGIRPLAAELTRIATAMPGHAEVLSAHAHATAD